MVRENPTSEPDQQISRTRTAPAAETSGGEAAPPRPGGLRVARPWPLGSTRRQSGALTADVLVAIGILLLAMVPLVVSVIHEQRLARAYYYRAVAMEIIDGEMEVLRAGEWRAFKEGSQPYVVRAESTSNLPPGRFVLTIANQRLRLEWRPDKKHRGGVVAREVEVK